MVSNCCYIGIFVIRIGDWGVARCALRVASDATLIGVRLSQRVEHAGSIMLRLNSNYSARGFD
jgi:hypothetical protein